MAGIPDRHYIDDVLQWRYEQALAAGMSKLQARVFAEGDADVDEMRRRLAELREAGCPERLAARIIL